MHKILLMKSNIRTVILIFFLALALRVLYLDQIKDTYLFYSPIVDSGAYDQSGVQAASGDTSKIYSYPLFRIPFYRLFLGIIYKVGGHNVYLARFIQAIVGALSCCLIYALAGLVFNRKTAFIAGLAASLYWPFIAFDAKFLPVNLAIFCSLLGILSISKFFERRKIPWIFAGGAALALASIARANIALVLPALFLWILFYFWKNAGAKKSLFYAGFFLAGFLFVMAPLLAKDYSARKEFMPIQKNYGVGVYFGADLDRINIKPGSTWRKLMRELLDKDLVHIQERNIYFLNKTAQIIFSDPAGYMAGLAKKIYILWNYYEFSPRECINYFRSKSRFLSLPLPSFGWVAAFSILGMILAWGKSREKATPLYIFVFMYQVALLPFMPLARYRLPIVPFLIVFASYCVTEIFAVIREKKWGVFAGYTAALLPILILTNTNPFLEYLQKFDRPYYHEGRARLRSLGDEDNALANLKVALKKHPKDADIYAAMGYGYARKGDLGKAEVCYAQALDIESRFPEAMNSLGTIYAKQGRIVEAKVLFKKVLAEFPDKSVDAHINLGNCYKMEGNYDMAEGEYKRALFLEPDYPPALYRLALLYEETGNPEAAVVRARYEKIVDELRRTIGLPRLENLDRGSGAG
ncbi:tetratricopeptide repeat protein [Candidatus Omnitrophota bacterium]